VIILAVPARSMDNNIYSTRAHARPVGGQEQINNLAPLSTDIS